MAFIEIPKIPTINDIDLKEKKVFLRIDINSPIDPDTGDIIDDRRIRVHAKTVRVLAEKYNAAVVAASHQGRPGEQDFVSLEKHAELLSKYSGLEVKFIDDVIGPAAREAIRKLEPGQVLLLDNLRFVSEELIEAVPEKHMNSYIVRRLAPLVDAYVNDAFAAAHRSQPSIVGFPMILPSAAGPVFEKEILALQKAFGSLVSPRIFVLGGGKVHDILRVIEHLVRNKAADRILTAGFVAQLFLVAKGLDIGRENLRVLEEKGILSLLPRARRLLYLGAPIETPVDYITFDGKEVREEYLGRIKGKIMDIGPNTINMYRDLMREAKVIVMRGPAGVIEDERFRNGTQELVKAALNSQAFVILGGGHLASLVGDQEIDESKCHVSTGGNALLLFLAGEKLPAIEALAMSAKMHVW
ncbi:phosphoglycerate kinase [Desulfurococcaceae archaeon MEX13E-LK6-19]|nr:phosphoglycerate kinase [Desulfurococcaceae archaeon MEX13E-LK6-19]